MKQLVLSGNKVNSFYQNLIGDEYHVTIDMYILLFFGHNKKSLNNSDYKYYSKAIRKLAKRMKVSPASCQAIIWIKERNKTRYTKHDYVF